MATNCQTFLLPAEPKQITDTCIFISTLSARDLIAKSWRQKWHATFKTAFLWEQTRWISFLLFRYHCSFQWSHRLLVHKMEHFTRMPRITVRIYQLAYFAILLCLRINRRTLRCCIRNACSARGGGGLLNKV